MLTRLLALTLALLLMVPTVAVAAGNCSVYRSWSSGDTLTAGDMNSSMTTIGVTNFVLSCMDDLSANAAQMASTTDPYPSSSESLATSAEGELLRTRYVINKGFGWLGGSWYKHTTRAQIPNANHTANGDLEAWSAGTSSAPDSWTLTGTNATVARDGTNFKHGTFAAAVTRVGNDAYLSQVVSTLKPPAAWWRSQTVTLGAWVRATVASRARLVINDGVGTSASSYHTGGSSFEHLTVTRTLDAAASTVEIRLQVDTGDTTAQFDAVTFTFGSYTTDFFPSGIASGTGSQTQVSRGLHLRTHPDSDSAASKVYLVRADEIVMDDGTRVSTWDRLVADITVAGANGLDTGAEAASTWYEVYAIRKSSDGTKGLLLHRAKDYFEDETSTAGEDGTHSLRTAATTNVKLAQGFQVDTAGALEFVDVKLVKAGSPTGNAYFTIESNAAGLPSGTVLATSDKFDVSLLTTTATTVRIIFRNPFTTVAATTYHLVLQADYAAAAGDNIGWRADTSAGAYANGSKASYDGTNWTADADDDFIFKIYVTRNDTSVTMPTGYDQKAKIGHVYNDGSSNFRKFYQQGGLVLYTPVTLRSAAAGSGVGTVQELDLRAYVPPGHRGALVRMAASRNDLLNEVRRGAFWEAVLNTELAGGAVGGDSHAIIPLDTPILYGEANASSSFGVYINGFKVAGGAD